MKTAIITAVILMITGAAHADTFMKFGEAGSMQHVLNLDSGSMDTYVGFDEVNVVVPAPERPSSDSSSNSGGNTYMKMGESGGMQHIFNLDSGSVDTFIGFDDVNPVYAPQN